MVDAASRERERAGIPMPQERDSEIAGAYVSLTRSLRDPGWHFKDSDSGHAAQMVSSTRIQVLDWGRTIKCSCSIAWTGCIARTPRFQACVMMYCARGATSPMTHVSPSSRTNTVESVIEPWLTSSASVQLEVYEGA